MQSEPISRSRPIQHRLRREIDSAAALLADAGVESARHDAEELAAHLIRAERGRLGLVDDPGDEFVAGFRDLVARRRNRVPLQHLTGVAAFGPVTLRVGPGVFIPRPETEAILEWALDPHVAQRLPDRPLIVDACTGSGALAVALARHWPIARVIAVDDSVAALDYAARNCAGTAVELVNADVCTPGLLSELDHRVDLVVANPPYLPDGAALEPEVGRHDPPHALFGGADGMAVITAVVAVAARLLRPGGMVAVEHDDTASAAVIERIVGTGRFADVTARPDLTGRPRFVTATRRRF